MLIELGSSALNFSSDAPSMLMSRLSCQSGPAQKGRLLRKMHFAFEDSKFCSVLLKQLNDKLEGIAQNCRETNCMQMVINLGLRLHSLAPSPNIQYECLNLLTAARSIAVKWFNQLKSEIHKATDAVTSRKSSRFAMLAAILCRRCLWVYGEENKVLDGEALKSYIQSSIVMQDNLDSNPSALPVRFKILLIADLKKVYTMRFLIRESFSLHPQSISSAINFLWGDSEAPLEGPPSSFTFLEEWWVQTIVISDPSLMPQTVHFHLLEGHLLVNCQSLGKLPAEHRDSVVLRELFGDQNLLTYPSPDPSMTWMLPVKVQGHQIHIGFRDK